MLKKIMQILLGILTCLGNTFIILIYFYLALSVLKGNRDYTIGEYYEFIASKIMLLIPLSYIIVLGLFSFLIYKFTDFKKFSVVFFTVGIVMTGLLYLLFRAGLSA